MKIKTLLSPLVVATLLAQGVSAAAATPADFSHQVEAIVARSLTPGLALAVVHRGKIVYAEGFGWRDPQRQHPMTVDTVNMWFSDTKLVTATAALQLVQRGLLELDQPIAELLPDHQLRGPGVERLTARHLLSHTSGLVHPLPFRWIRLESEPVERPADFYRRVIGEYGELQYEPGYKFSYSNLNYLVLGRLIAVRSGQSYEAYVQEHILAPLGMQRTGFGPSTRWGADVAVPSMKVGLPYTIAVGWLADDKVFAGNVNGYRALHPFNMIDTAMGGLKGSLLDATRFLEMQLGHDGGRVLAPRWLEEMQRVVPTADGATARSALGWHLRSDRSGTFLMHRGGAAGATSELRIYPDLDLGIAVFANASGTWTPVLPAVDSVAVLAARTWGQPQGVAIQGRHAALAR